MLRLILVSVAIFGALICALLAIFAWRRRPASGAVFLAGALMSTAIYAFGYGLELSSTTIENMLACIRLEYLGVAWLPGFWLALSLHYTNHLKWLRPRRFWLIWIIPVVVLLGVWTNPLHHLHYSSVSVNAGGPFFVLQFERGPIYWLHMGYTFFSFLVSAFWLVQYLLSPHLLYRKQSGLMLASSLLTILIVTLYLAGLQPIPHLDIIVYALIVSSVLVGYGLLRFHLVALSPAARDALFDSLDDAVIVLDANNLLVDYNAKAAQFFHFSGNPIGLSLAQFVPQELQEAFQDLRHLEGVREFNLDAPQRRYFEIHPSGLEGIGSEPVGLLVVIHEITQQKQMQLALELANADLERRVALRTQEYLTTIQQLEGEIHTRQQAEQKLREMQANLVEQVSMQSRKLYTLYDVLLNKEISGMTDEVLTQMLQRICQMMSADAACIHEARSDALYSTGSIGLPPGTQEALAILPGSWLIEGKPLVTNDLPHDERLPEALRLTGFTTYLAAPIRLNEVVTGLLQVFWRASYHVSVEDISYFSIIAEQIGIILENARLRQILEERAVQGERRRLARDLHDSVTQSLHSLSLYVSILRNRLEQGQARKAMEMLDKIDQSARQSLKEMRLLLYELRLVPLEDIRLVEALRNRLDAVETRAGIDAVLDVAEGSFWPPKWEAELYCIAMEALNNALKHANASAVQVRLAGKSTWAELSISDNGKGFSPEKVANGGIGLQSMRERAERLGGSLQIESAPGQGTTIRVSVNLPGVQAGKKEVELDSHPHGG